MHLVIFPLRVSIYLPLISNTRVQLNRCKNQTKLYSFKQIFLQLLIRVLCFKHLYPCAFFIVNRKIAKKNVCRVHYCKIHIVASLMMQYDKKLIANLVYLRYTVSRTTFSLSIIPSLLKHDIYDSHERRPQNHPGESARTIAGHLILRHGRQRLSSRLARPLKFPPDSVYRVLLVV